MEGIQFAAENRESIDNFIESLIELSPTVSVKVEKDGNKWNIKDSEGRQVGTFEYERKDGVYSGSLDLSAMDKGNREYLIQAFSHKSQ